MASSANVVLCRSITSTRSLTLKPWATTLRLCKKQLDGGLTTKGWARALVEAVRELATRRVLDMIDFFQGVCISMRVMGLESFYVVLSANDYIKKQHELFFSPIETCQHASPAWAQTRHLLGYKYVTRQTVRWSA